MINWGDTAPTQAIPKPTSCATFGGAACLRCAQWSQKLIFDPVNDLLDNVTFGKSPQVTHDPACLPSGSAHRGGAALLALLHAPAWAAQGKPGAHAVLIDRGARTL